MTTIYKYNFEIGKNKFKSVDADNLVDAMLRHDMSAGQPEEVNSYSCWDDASDALGRFCNSAEYVKTYSGSGVYVVTVYWIGESGDEGQEYADDMPHVYDGYTYEWTEEPYWYAVQKLDVDGTPVDNDWSFGSLDKDEAQEMGESYEHYQIVTIDLTGDNGNGIAIHEERF